MRLNLLLLTVLLVNLSVFSQVQKKDWSDEIVFNDGSRLISNSVINKKNLQLSKNDISIYKKTFQAQLRDIGKSPLQINEKTLAAISKRNKLISKKIKENINGYYSFEQNGKDISVLGLNSVKNQYDLDRCVKSQSCRLNCEVTIIQLSLKDGTENLILLTSAKIL